MSEPRPISDVLTMTPEELVEWAKQKAAATTAVHGTPPTISQADLDADYLASCGFGKRYQHPDWSRVPADVATQVAAYTANLIANLEEGRGMLLVGLPGTGKTHILALVALAARNKTVRRVEYVFAPHLFDALHRGDRDEVGRWAKAGLLLLDDVCRLYSTDWNTARFDTFAEDRYAAKLATVATMNTTDVLRNEGLQRLKDRWSETLPAVTTQAQSQRGK